jgi:hypothetical protein
MTGTNGMVKEKTGTTNSAQSLLNKERFLSWS